ncbi:hypothetical protein [Streptomyces vietnamensis]|uniref:hypothetical protein n=1 Tax=Streptomyces vietnamensis TaxID=362257 RepID=UPI0006965A59|nr:hypothetical protein [Streptomyces vietnamensis]
MHDPALTAGRIFRCLDADRAALRAGRQVPAAAASRLVTDRLAGEIAVETDGVTGSWVRPLGPAQLLAALWPGSGRLTGELTDAVLRALLRCSAGHDRPVTPAARILCRTAAVPAAEAAAHVGAAARASQHRSSRASSPVIVRPLSRQEIRGPRPTSASPADDEVHVPLTYALTVMAHVGRWEIAGRAGAPAHAAAAISSAGVGAQSPTSNAITITGPAPADRTKTATLGSQL